jgi:glycine oxidase
MASRERTAVVGGGIIGCAIAFELSRRGADVTVFEASTIGSGATHASAGILAPYTEAHEGGDLFELTVRGLSAYPDFVAAVRDRSAVGFEYRRSGTIEVAEDGERAQALRARAGGELAWLDAVALRQLVPDVMPDAIGGLHCPLHGYVTVRAFVAALADGAARCGARFQNGARVEQIAPSGPSLSVRVGGVDHPFERVILSAGAWTPGLDPTGRLRDRIKPVRGQLVRLALKGVHIGPVLWSRRCYVVPWEDGTVLVGATSEDAGFEVRATAEGVRDLLLAGTQVVPSLSSASFMDGMPLLGPSPSEPRIIYAAGHYRNGVLLAPLTARLIADHVFTNAVDSSFVRT